MAINSGLSEFSNTLADVSLQMFNWLSFFFVRVKSVTVGSWLLWPILPKTRPASSKLFRPTRILTRTMQAFSDSDSGGKDKFEI